MRVLHKLRYNLDKAYRIKIGVGIDVDLTKRQKKALVAMCKEYLSDHDHCKLNPERTELYAATIKLYEDESAQVELSNLAFRRIYRDRDRVLKSIKPSYVNFEDIIGDYAGWYWT